MFFDPIGEKLAFLADAAAAGYNVVLCFIGIADSGTSKVRVAMRVSQGGHDVPSEKLASRFRRAIENLKAAIQILPIVLIFDNDDLADPFRKFAEFRDGKPLTLSEPIPEWFRPSL